MELELLRYAGQAITMPKEMRHRISEYCREQTKEEGYMMKGIRKTTAAFAALAVCICLTVTQCWRHRRCSRAFLAISETFWGLL